MPGHSDQGKEGQKTVLRGLPGQGGTPGDPADDQHHGTAGRVSASRLLEEATEGHAASLDERQRHLREPHGGEYSRKSTDGLATIIEEKECVQLRL